MMRGITSPSRRRAFTLVELLVSISVLAVLASLVMVAVPKVRAKGQAAKCMNNMRQIGMAFLAYAADHDNKLPCRSIGNSERWPTLLHNGYLVDPAAFACPSDPKNPLITRAPITNNFINNTSYIFNGLNQYGTFSDPNRSVQMNQLPSPANTILIGEGKPGDSNFYMDIMEDNEPRVLDKTRHMGSAHYIFGDGSCRPLWPGRDYQPELWDPTRS